MTGALAGASRDIGRSLLCPAVLPSCARDWTLNRQPWWNPAKPRCFRKVRAISTKVGLCKTVSIRFHHPICRFANNGTDLRSGIRMSSPGFDDQHHGNQPNKADRVSDVSPGSQPGFYDPRRFRNFTLTLHTSKTREFGNDTDECVRLIELQATSPLPPRHDVQLYRLFLASALLIQSSTTSAISALLSSWWMKWPLPLMPSSASLIHSGSPPTCLR